MRDNIENKVSNYKPIVWTDAEWDAIAWTLRGNFPRRYFGGSNSIPLNLDEFEDAVEASLPQGRHKFFDDVAEVITPLMQSFKRIYNSIDTREKVENTTQKKNKRKKDKLHIYWTKDEWMLVALELIRLFPESSKNRFAAINIQKIREAIKILPIARQRYVKHIPIFQIGFINALEAAVKTPEIMEVLEVYNPLKKPKEIVNDTPMDMAMANAFDKPEQKKAYWGRDDWALVAKEMMRQNPHFDFFNCQFFHIDTQAIKDAQREVLPLERRRKTFHESKKLRPKLLEIFAYLKNNQSQNVVSEPVIEVPSTTILEQPTAQETPKFSAPAVANLIQEAASKTMTSDFASRLSAVTTPLIDMLIQEITDRVSSQLMKAFEPLLKAPSLTEIQPVSNSLPEVSEVISLPHKFIAPKPVPVVKKPKIAVLGPFGKQKEFLNQAFPQYDFSYIEHGHGIKEVAPVCVLFVVSTKHMNLSSRDLIKKHVPSTKLRYVDGGLSNIKHQITVWEATNKCTRKQEFSWEF